MSDEEFTQVPVTLGFGNTEVPIGWMRIRTDALPATPNFVFALGFQALEKHQFAPGGVPNAPYVGPYKLGQVAIVDDESYIGYLRQIEKLPPEGETRQK